MLIRFTIFTAAAALIVGSQMQTPAQAKRRKAPTAPAAAATRPTQPEPTPTPRGKRNERPDSNPGSGIAVDPKRPDGAAFPFIYEFTQPDFPISKIVISHDDAGSGTISFTKRGASEVFSDPIRISAASVAKIREAYQSLDFLSSRENYQYVKDYSHLGNVVLKLKQDNRERSVTFNWTENKNARALADEYRRIGNQFIWIFDITVARENQPLEAPQLLTSLDSLIKRNEIADPPQLSALLRELSDDERIPLIARNHAAKLIKQIEKMKK